MSGQEMSFEKLLQPIRIGDMELSNRVVLPPMVTNYAGRDGSVTERLIDYLEERAKGRMGLIIVEATSIDSAKTVVHQEAWTEGRHPTESPGEREQGGPQRWPSACAFSHSCSRRRAPERDDRK
jgi:hypothetical protein